MARLTLETPIRYLKGVGERREEAFRRLGVATVEDLLYHTPRRYLDATHVTPATQASVGREVTCVGTVVAAGVVPTRSGLRIFRAVLQDTSGHLECAWPGQAFLERQIRVGQRLLVSGTVKHYHGRQLNPREFVILTEADGVDAGPERGFVLPIYPATEGLTHRQIRHLLEQHLPDLLTLVSDHVGPELRGALPALRDALHAVHRPASLEEAERGRRRLAFDELFESQLLFARAREVATRQRGGTAFQLLRTLTTQLKERLPFTLTGGQRAAIREITRDMTSSLRMHRLLMGDVGVGKTVVALFAALLALENGFQAAFMAPTELLAEQHTETMRVLLRDLEIEPELLTGRLAAADKRRVQQRVADGAARLVVGTHALIQDELAFHRLGLVVIDEQHRFGVEQRARLVAKGDVPDVLLLSATPIPRSLALAKFGDLDVTGLKEKPAGRASVKTTVRTDRARESVYAFVERECRGGRQAYVVYPVIDESERADLRAATTMAEQLGAQLAPLRVGLVHGRLPADERERTMREFRAGSVQVLVATTVIEVGIDVPNASTMVIEHAERFGLAQLHQLRGRVGRGSHASHCILVAAGASIARLRAFAATDDGFRIAELDLAERGQGDLVGTRQAGGPEFRYADLARDLALLTEANGLARRIVASDPGLTRDAHRPLRDRLFRRHQRAMELFRVG